MVPCQDTPGIKFTYTASITVPSELVALMSATSSGSAFASGSDSKKVFKFEQKVAIPVRPSVFYLNNSSHILLLLQLEIYHQKPLVIDQQYGVNQNR